MRGFWQQSEQSAVGIPGTPGQVHPGGLGYGAVVSRCAWAVRAWLVDVWEGRGAGRGGVAHAPTAYRGLLHGELLV